MSTLALAKVQTTDLSPADLVMEINDAHRACEAAARSAVEHALRAGELLERAKAGVAHGFWGMWIQDNCEFSERTAQVYMRVARELPKLDDAKAQRVADLPLREVAKLLSAPKTRHEEDEGSLEWVRTGLRALLQQSTRYVDECEAAGGLATEDGRAAFRQFVTLMNEAQDRHLDLEEHFTLQRWNLGHALRDLNRQVKPEFRRKVRESVGVDHKLARHCLTISRLSWDVIEEWFDRLHETRGEYDDQQLRWLATYPRAAYRKYGMCVEDVGEGAT